MDFSVSNTEGRIHLTGEITIYAAQALKQQLFALIESGQPIDVDASAVTILDSAGLQLLLMLRKTSGGALRVHSPSDAVRDVLEMCGLRSMIAVAGTA
jgi:anti-sigma B factor antagonist